MAVGLPIISALLLVTLIGLPLGLVGLLSLALLYTVGYVVAALLLGRKLVREPRSVYLAFFIGLVICASSESCRYSVGWSVPLPPSTAWAP